MNRHRELFARAASLDGFAAACAEAGIEAEPLLRQASLMPELLQDPDARISYRAYLRVLDLAAQASRMPHFGLLLAEQQTLAMLGPVGFLFAEAHSLGDAITELGAYIHLHNEAISLRLEVSEQTASWSLESLNVDAPGQTQNEDHVLATGLSLLQLFAGRDWNPVYVSVQHAAPPNVAPYRRKFGCPVGFAAERVQIVFDASLLRLSVKGRDPRLHAILDGYIRQMDASLALQPGKRVQLVILEGMRRGDCSLRYVSNEMGLTPRSLQRRLTVSGSSFQTELDAVRSGVARRYLTETQMPLTEIAALLEYSDLSAFSRAFKRLNGLSPRAWRQQQVRRGGGEG